MLHHGEDTTTDNQVQMSPVFISVPLVLNLAEHSRVNPIEILKLINDDCEGTLSGQLKKIAKQRSHRREMPNGNAEFSLSFLSEVLTQQALCLSGNKEIKNK